MIVRLIGVLFAAAFVASALTGSASAINNVTCGAKIKSPGSYKLREDCTGRGITVAASNVTLDLARHTITGDGTTDGIHVEGVDNIRILGPGVIKKYYDGIYVSDAEHVYVGNVTSRKSAAYGAFVQSTQGMTFEGTVADNNGAHGFLAYFGSDGTVFDHVQADGNTIGGVGIYLSSDSNLVKGSRVDGNLIGIYADGHSNTIRNNSAFGNGIFDLYDGNSGCDSNVWMNNSFGSASPSSCIS